MKLFVQILIPFILLPHVAFADFSPGEMVFDKVTRLVTNIKKINDDGVIILKNDAERSPLDLAQEIQTDGRISKGQFISFFNPVQNYYDEGRILYIFDNQIAFFEARQFNEHTISYVTFSANTQNLGAELFDSANTQNKTEVACTLVKSGRKVPAGTKVNLTKYFDNQTVQISITDFLFLKRTEIMKQDHLGPCQDF